MDNNITNTNTNNIAFSRSLTSVRFASDNNKTKTVSAVRNESLVDRYVNSAHEASRASMVDNSMIRAFGQKVIKVAKIFNPEKLNTPEVTNESKKVDMEITQYVQSGAYEKDFKHNSINYVA